MNSSSKSYPLTSIITQSDLKATVQKMLKKTQRDSQQNKTTDKEILDEYQTVLNRQEESMVKKHSENGCSLGQNLLHHACPDPTTSSKPSFGTNAHSNRVHVDTALPDNKQVFKIKAC